MSVKATMIMTRVTKMNRLNRIQALLETFMRTVSVMERPLLRTEATSAPISCTPPMKIEPTRIQISAGTQP